MSNFPIRQMSVLRHALMVDDLALISGQEEIAPLTHKHKSIKQKNFHQPLEIRAIDLWIDFQLYFDKGDYEGATPFYYRLKRIIG